MAQIPDRIELHGVKLTVAEWAKSVGIWHHRHNGGSEGTTAEILARCKPRKKSASPPS